MNMACSNFKSPRIQREILSLKKNPPPGISCYPVDEAANNVLTASIVGTTGSPYEKGVFQLEVTVGDRYPFEPPRVRFRTPLYHPNVDGAGRICLDMLKMPPSGSWKPVFTIEGLLTSIQYLMTNPNPDDPLMPDIASQYKYNKEEFNREARAWTQKHACASALAVSLPTSEALEDQENQLKRDNNIESSSTKKRQRIE